MEGIIAYNREEKELLQMALYGYMNHYRQRIKEIDNIEQKEVVQGKIQMVEKLLSEIGG